MPTTESGRAARAWTDVRLLQTDRGPVEVAVAGSGPAVLVIHGTPGSWRQCFSLAEDLSGTHTVIAPSRPGYGLTPLASGRTFGEQADLYAAALDTLGIERATIVGASGGGPSSVAFAERHAGRCDGLVLVCALVPHLIHVPPLLRYLTATRGLGELVTALSRSGARRQLGSARAIDKVLARQLTPDEAARCAADPRIREDLIAFARTHLDAPPGLRGVRNDLAQVRAAKAAAPPALSVTAPALVLQGDADPVVSMEEARHLAGAISGATLEIYAGAGHAFFFTRRDEVARRIRTFLGDRS